MTLLLIIYLNYFIVDIDGTKSNTGQPQKIMRKHKMKMTLHELRIKHKNEMSAQFETKHVYYKDLPPLFKIHIDSQTRYALLNEGFYETLYDTEYKIPVYSAYTLDLNHEKIVGRKGGYMRNTGLTFEEQPTLTAFKGISKKGLDRGHLFPQLFAAESTQMRKYTNLITNIALQYGTFNQNLWRRLEFYLHKASTTYCHYEGSKLYYLTGVIPGEPFADNHFGEINIPSHFWTAVCCDTSLARQNTFKFAGWSFAYIVKNQIRQGQPVEMYFIEDFLKTWQMKGTFSQLFKTYATIKGCSFDSLQGAIVIKSIMHWDRVDTFVLHDKLYKSFRTKSVPLRRKEKWYNGKRRSFG